MAWNMGNAELMRALLSKKHGSDLLKEGAAAQAVADALLRAVGRQAIIAAAADAVSALNCHGGATPVVATTTTTSVNPGGGQGGEDPDMPAPDNP